MKLSGQQLSIREVFTVKLPRLEGEPISLKVCGIPIGFNAAYERIWPRPRPPQKPVVNLGGGKTVKEEDYADPMFMAEHKDYEFYKNIYLVYKGLQADSSVSFDCLAGAELKDKSQLVSIAQEMSSAGLSEGDINILMSGIHAASHISEKEVEAATKGF